MHNLQDLYLPYITFYSILLTFELIMVLNNGYIICPLTMRINKTILYFFGIAYLLGQNSKIKYPKMSYKPITFLILANKMH
jgi:hypothetical protein